MQFQLNSLRAPTRDTNNSSSTKKLLTYRHRLAFNITTKGIHFQFTISTDTITLVSCPSPTSTKADAQLIEAVSQQKHRQQADSHLIEAVACQQQHQQQQTLNSPKQSSTSKRKSIDNIKLIARQLNISWTLARNCKSRTSSLHRSTISSTSTTVRVSPHGSTIWTLSPEA